MHNLEDTLSINHNWLNGYNIHWAWALLQQEHSDATAAIEDCRYSSVCVLHKLVTRIFGITDLFKPCASTLYQAASIVAKASPNQP